MGERIVTGEALDPHPIPGKQGSVNLTIQAAHDDDYLAVILRDWSESLGVAPVSMSRVLWAET